MSEATEPTSLAVQLVGAVREGITCSREPAHLYGLVRGLDIALSTLRSSHADLSVAVRELRERASRLTGFETYQSGVATGLELASDLTMRWLHRYSHVSPHSVLAIDELRCVK